ncbi:ECF RNA polymerase sigma factor SigW [Phycisphaerae bacterium RAS1]|nr:ECF RNA polymerase sigma factor SigW [Phycisphaerae bacterium RAS1]
MSDNTPELLLASMNGDSVALSSLLERHAVELRRRMAGRISPVWQNVLDVDDILQVTFMEAFLRIGQFVPGKDSSFVAWLTRIAENNLKDAVKELSRVKRPPPDRRVGDAAGNDSFASFLDQLAQTSATPSRVVRWQEARGVLEQALGRLPSDYETVIRGYDLEQKTAAELAAQLQRSEGAVFMLRARAHDRLRDLLNEQQLFSDH